MDKKELLQITSELQTMRSVFSDMKSELTGVLGDLARFKKDRKNLEQKLSLV